MQMQLKLVNTDNGLLSSWVYRATYQSEELAQLRSLGWLSGAPGSCLNAAPALPSRRAAPDSAGRPLALHMQP